MAEAIRNFGGIKVLENSMLSDGEIRLLVAPDVMEALRKLPSS